VRITAGANLLELRFPTIAHGEIPRVRASDGAFQLSGSPCQ